MKLINQIVSKSLAASLAAAFLLGGSVFAAEPLPSSPPVVQHNEGTVYATVNGQPISVIEYTNTFNSSLKQKYYHGAVPEGKMAEAREEVFNQMVMRILLVEEAKRRGLVPDEKKLAETIAGYEAKYVASPTWKQDRERLLPGLREKLAEMSLLEQLEKSVRALPEMSDAEVKRFYDAHPELFTEPEKLHLSVILLTVDPSAPSTAWEQARAEAKAIHARLLGGADFAEAARMHSSGKEAAQGGDLGYVHAGMLPESLQQKIDSVKVGEIAEPITMLEGIAIFYLKDRRVAQLRAYADVAARAKELARREAEDAAWSGLQARLKSTADIKIMAKAENGNLSTKDMKDMK